MSAQQQQQQQPQTAQRPGPRLHRLPRRLDYILVPAPLDLSLDTMTEKSPLPAIIVTPSSPTHSKDFAIAFLAPPQKPCVAKRVYTAICARTEAVVNRFQLPAWVPGSRSGYSPIALPISAPATTTEFPVGSFGAYSKAKRNSRILMVVLALFVLMFCHMLAHLFVYASMEGSAGVLASTSSGSGAGEVGGDAMMVVVTGTGKGTVGNYLNKLEMQNWLGWLSGRTASGAASSAAVVTLAQ